MRSGLAAILLIFLPMLVEARRAALNERIQRSRGGIEPPGDVYAIMQFAYPAAFLLMLGEAYARGVPSIPIVTAGLIVFLAAKALKWWAILTLGPFWTFRVIVIRGARLVKSGPYRLMTHPNYVAVAGELIGIAIMTGAIVSGPLATIGFGLLMIRRISIEERALGM